MLRRFEVFSLHPAAPPADVAKLRLAFLDCARFVPEVLHAAVGANLSDTPLDLVWEGAFASASAYQRYMVHPFHAAVLDRYLLVDSAERVTSDNGLQAGLIGYECDAVASDGVGARRVTLLRIDPEASPDDTLRLGSSAAAPTGAVSSVLAPNTMGPRWFDAVEVVGPPPRWTHVWEQSFATLDDARATDPSVVTGDAAVAASLELLYEIERVIA